MSLSSHTSKQNVCCPSAPFVVESVSLFRVESLEFGIPPLGQTNDGKTRIHFFSECRGFIASQCIYCICITTIWHKLGKLCGYSVRILWRTQAKFYNINRRYKSAVFVFGIYLWDQIDYILVYLIDLWTSDSIFHSTSISPFFKVPIPFIIRHH